LRAAIAGAALLAFAVPASAEPVKVNALNFVTAAALWKSGELNRSHPSGLMLASRRLKQLSAPPQSIAIHS